MTDVTLEWGEVGARRLGADCAVVVVCDVLSFSTAVSAAVTRGVQVAPYPSHGASATGRAAELGALLAGARGEPGSLSPASLLALAPGTRVLLPSPNGATLTLLAAEQGATVVAGCLRNAAAVATWLAAVDGAVGLVAAGERWPDGSLRPAYEDWVGAGAIAARLADATLSPEAEAAALAAAHRRPLREVASGRELLDRGFGQDVDAAEDEGADDVVPVLRDGWFVPAG